MIRVGCSGFSYAEWRGTFYAAALPAARMLQTYAEQLPAVELNNTFQRSPTPATIASWVARTPAAFRLCPKGHRALTYSAAAFPKTEMARGVRTALLGLGDRLGPVLLQFPPTRQVDLGLLDELLGALGLPVAVEFRHASWFGSETTRVLAAHGAASCVTEGEKWPRGPLEATAPFVYLRLRSETYTAAQQAAWRARLAELDAEYDEVYAFVRHGPDAPGIALALSVE